MDQEGTATTFGSSVPQCLDELTVGVQRSRYHHRTQEGGVISSSGANVAPSTIIIKPKLRAPASRPEQLVRPRLLELLGTFSEHEATLISAPAGYGKTTLLAQRPSDGCLAPFRRRSIQDAGYRLRRTHLLARLYTFASEGIGTLLIAHCTMPNKP
jgi:hypothetical protein